MRITVFGANGKVGTLVVHQALQNGYEVVAFVHSNHNFESFKNLKVIKGDICNVKNVDMAIKGSDLVISALGSWGTPKKDILTAGMKNIIPTMQKYGIKRIITLTGADASISGEKYNLLDKVFRIFIKLFASKILLDGENHIKLLSESGLDWTVVRSPVMNNNGLDTDFVLTGKKPQSWETINRNSVATTLVDLINSNKFTKQAPYISRK